MGHHKYNKNDYDGNGLTGRFIEKNGYGFFIPDDEGIDDIYISKDDINGAFHKDKVVVRVLADDQQDETEKHKRGKIIKVLERSIKTFVGTYNKSKEKSYVKPDNPNMRNVYIDRKRRKGSVTGSKVVVEITNYDTMDGRIVEVLGHVNDPGVDILSIVKAHGIPTEFDKDVMKQVYFIPDEVLEDELEGRRDIRHLPTVTIDGEDAKDLDDAITISREGNGYYLGVHIADVTHYVTENSPLDKEALKRGTSVYLVDRVIPQLPHALSNGICSLNQGCDRLALSCFIHINDKGEVTDHEIVETVVNVDRRMTYTNVNKIIENLDPNVSKRYEDFIDMFMVMKEAAEVLINKRQKRGAIDFDFPESKIILDKDGDPLRIELRERNKATRIIEEFMLIANETIAEDFYWRESPFVYRIHENPDEEKLIKLGAFVNKFGYTLKGISDDIHPKEIQKLVRKAVGKPEEPLLNMLTLRSMKQAKYSIKCEGHFGLATDYYCHFTSPIRRYPDLQIHRIIKESLKGGLSNNRTNHYNKILPDVASHSSVTERRADAAEMEVDKLKKAEYMTKYIGEVFEGTISSLSVYGMYVELDNTVTGMVRISDIPDDIFIYDEDNYKIYGSRTNTQYMVGQRVKVKVINTDLTIRTIDFELYKENEEQ